MGIDLIAIKLWRGNESVGGFNDHIVKEVSV